MPSANDVQFRGETRSLDDTGVRRTPSSKAACLVSWPVASLSVAEMAACLAR